MSQITITTLSKEFKLSSLVNGKTEITFFDRNLSDPIFSQQVDPAILWDYLKSYYRYAEELSNSGFKRRKFEAAAADRATEAWLDKEEQNEPRCDTP